MTLRKSSKDCGIASMTKALKKTSTKNDKKSWKNEGNNTFAKKLSQKITKMLKFVNVKPVDFKNKEKVKMSKSTIDFMCEEVLFSLIESQREGIKVGDIESYTPKDVRKVYESKLKNLSELLNDYKKSTVELYGETSLVNIEAYMSAKSILIGDLDKSSLEYHLSVLEEYIGGFPDEVYNLPWLRLAHASGAKRISELSCNS